MHQCQKCYTKLVDKFGRAYVPGQFVRRGRASGDDLVWEEGEVRVDSWTEDEEPREQSLEISSGIFLLPPDATWEITHDSHGVPIAESDESPLPEQRRYTEADLRAAFDAGAAAALEPDAAWQALLKNIDAAQL